MCSNASDDALTLDEWTEFIEECEALDIPRFTVEPDYHFIMCLDYTIMLEKDYYLLLL